MRLSKAFPLILVIACFASCNPVQTRGTSQTANPAPTGKVEMTQTIVTEPATPSPRPSPTVEIVKGMGNTAGNINNGGFAAESEGSIYYRGKDGFLYRMAVDGSLNTKLNSDDSSYINVLGDTIYYRNQSDGGKIYAMKTDGSSRQALNDTDSRYVTVKDGWIYYLQWTQPRHIMRMKADGSDQQELPVPEDGIIDSISLQDDTMVYYCTVELKDRKSETDPYDIAYLKQMDLDGSNNKELDHIDYYNGGAWGYGSVHDFANNIYCIDWNGNTASQICEMDDQTGEKQTIDPMNDTAAISLNAQEDHLYYIVTNYGYDLPYGSAVVRADLNGENPEVVVKSSLTDAYQQVCIAGNWLFYRESSDEVSMIAKDTTVELPDPVPTDVGYWGE